MANFLIISQHFLFLGQMLFFAEWNTILFLCSPIVSSVEGLQFAGLFINDLAMHDFSRDLLLTGKRIYKVSETFSYAKKGA